MKENCMTRTPMNVAAISAPEPQSQDLTNRSNLSRRDFCTLAAALGAVTLGASNKLLAQPSPLQISLSIDSATILAKVPADYMGLSYESGQLAYPDFFAPQNTALINMFHDLIHRACFASAATSANSPYGLTQNPLLRQTREASLVLIRAIANRARLPSRQNPFATCKDS